MKFLSCRDEGSILTHEHEPTEKRALLTTCGPSEVISSTSDQKPVKLRVFSLHELETATGGFDKAFLLGKGSHGCLYKGTLKDGKLVAVKRQEFLQDEAAFNNELEILSTLHSSRFVNLVGFSRGLDAQEKLLVVDFMANGTLYDILHHGSSSSSSSSCSSAMSTAGAAAAIAEPLGWSIRVQIAMQTAKALLALHSASPPVIHRDVKSSSVLIDSKWNAKLGDFGLALRGRNEDERGRVGAGAAVGYMDPEDDTPGSRISTKVDVFSFGILLLEILSGRNAIDVRFKPPSIIDWALPLIKQGKAHAIYDRRLILLPHYSKALKLMAGIAARCLKRCSVRRPTMNYVVAALQEVSKKIPMAKWADGLATVIKLTTSSCQNPHVLRDVRANPEFNNTNSIMRGPRTVSNIGKPRLGVDRPVPSGKTTPPPPRPPLQQRVLEQQDYYTNVALSKFVSRARSMDRASSVDRASSMDRASYYMDRASSMDRPVTSHFREQNRRLAQASGFARHGNVQRPLRQGQQEEQKEKKEEAATAAKELPRATMEVSMGGRTRTYHQWRNPMFDVESRSPERVLVLPVEACIRPTPAKRLGSLSDGAIPMVRLDDEADGRAAAAPLVPRPPSTRAATPEEGSACMPTLPISMSNKVISRHVRSSSRKSHIKTRDNFEREEAMLPW